MNFATAALVFATALVLWRTLAPRTSAAFRHLLLTAGFSVALLAPIVAMLAARSEPIRRIQSTIIINVTPSEGDGAGGHTQPGREVPWDRVVAGASAAGLALWLLRLAATLVHRRRTGRPASDEIARMGHLLRREVGITQPVRFQVAESISVPETRGFLRPVVLLPADSVVWPGERIRTVLLHELLHVRRGDWLAGMIAEATAALHWFNPLAWIALRLQRREREIACDDAVLAHGVDGCDYADQLIAFVAGLRPRAAANSVAMAEMSHLEIRVRSILNPFSRRGGTDMKTKLAVAAVAAAVLIGVSGVQAIAQSGGVAGLSGTVLDASSARVPQASVVVRNVETKKVEIVRTDEIGEFRFSALPAGTYDVEIAKGGFKLYRQENVLLAPGSAQNLSVVLSLGRIVETLDVKGVRPNAAGNAATVTDVPRRIRIGGSVQAAKVVKMARPAYPEHLKAAGVEGTVLLDAVIGRDGRIVNLQPANSQVHADLVKSATDAVSQWQYEPTYLNGEPVEIVTSITVNYTLTK